MRLVFLMSFILLLSCNKKEINNNIVDIDINENLTFKELKNLIEKKGLSKDYPNINKWIIQ